MGLRGTESLVVAVASGKGGTGKTTVSVNLARVIGSPVQILDCDVEEPNAQLFLGGRLTESRPVVTLIPEVDDARCDGCGDCARLCEFNAIVSFGTAPLVFPELCHSCGGCARVCPTQAIREVERRIGVLETYEAGDITLIQGIMDVGVAMAPPLIREVKSTGREGVPAILDAPPGTSCPVITTIRGADCVVLVTEPTPFGLHDLVLAVEVVRQLGLPVGVVVNRMGLGDDRVHRFCREQRIPILLEIPDDRRIAEAYSRGRLAVDVLPEYRAGFETLWQRTLDLAEAR